MNPVIHGLKIWPVYFDAVRNGTKTFEYRKNDRDFQVGDILHLQEWENTIREYTGRELRMEVTYLLELKDEMCILGIRKVGPGTVRVISPSGGQGDNEQLEPRTVKEARVKVRFGDQVCMDMDLCTWILRDVFTVTGDAVLALDYSNAPDVELTLDGEKIVVEWPEDTEEDEGDEDAP